MPQLGTVWLKVELSPAAKETIRIEAERLEITMRELIERFAKSLAERN